MDRTTITKKAPPGSSPRNHRHRGEHSRFPFGLIAHVLVFVGAGTAVFVHAGLPQGSLGIFLVCAGAALTLCPPAVKVSGWLWLVAAALVACSSLAFLPAHWLPLPAWRKALETLSVIPATPLITPVPWQTAFWLALLVGTVLTGLFLLAQPLRSEQMLGLATAAGLVCAAYAVLAIYAKNTGWRYPFDGGATFGFFPNRNHTAAFLITGSIVSMGVLRLSFREARWMVAGLGAASLIVCVVSLAFYSSSRGGIIFLLVGTLLWVVGIGSTQRGNPLLVSLVVLLLAGGTLFLVSGSEVRSRLVESFKTSQSAESPVPGSQASTIHPSNAHGDVPPDGRVLIYKDTLPLIKDFPLTGTGLGAFASVFPQYRNFSLSEFPAVHPESDWLMLMAEAGIPTFFCLLVLIWLLGRRLPPLRGHPYWPVRWGCVAAAAAAMLHGTVDVPAHHVSLGWWMLNVALLGLQPGRVQTAARSYVQHAVFVVGGVAMLALGVQLVRAEWFGGAPLSPFVVEQAQADLARAYEQRQFDAALRMNQQAITASPWDGRLYYQWAVLELPYSDSDAQVDATFQAQQLLDPRRPGVCVQQGEAWIHYDDVRTASLWLEALARRQRFDRLSGIDPTTDVGLYRNLMERAVKWPDVQSGLLAAIGDQPAYVLAWLEYARPELVDAPLETWSQNDKLLRSFNTDERRRFLQAWYAKGDRAKLARFIDAHEDWQAPAWPVRLRQWVDTQQFEQAVRAAVDHYQISLALPLPEAAPTEADGQPEPSDPVAAFTGYWRSGNVRSARRVLDEATNENGLAVSPELWRLKTADAVQRQDWAAAWQDLRQYLRAVHGDESW